MSGLASIQAQLTRHRNAYLAAGAGAVVLLALRNRKKSTAAAGAAVPAAITSGNPQFSAGAAQLDTSSLTSQLYDIQSSLNGLAASTTPNGTVPNPATQAGGGLIGGLPISAPLGGGSAPSYVTQHDPTMDTAAPAVTGSGASYDPGVLAAAPAYSSYDSGTFLPVGVDPSPGVNAVRHGYADGSYQWYVLPA